MDSKARVEGISAAASVGVKNSFKEQETIVELSWLSKRQGSVDNLDSLKPESQVPESGESLFPLVSIIWPYI